MRYASVAKAEASLLEGWRWHHFTIRELACRCAGRYCDGAYWHDPGFLDGLELFREKAGSRPLFINSGHRCRLWNARIGGAPRSRHKKIAADVSVHGHRREVLLEAARKSGFTGLGLGRGFLHVDRRAVPAIWDYQGSGALWKI